MAYLYLTLANSNGQDQGHAKFTVNISKWWQIGKTLQLPWNWKSYTYGLLNGIFTFDISTLLLLLLFSYYDWPWHILKVKVKHNGTATISISKMTFLHDLHVDEGCYCCRNSAKSSVFMIVNFKFLNVSAFVLNLCSYLLQSTSVVDWRNNIN